VGAADITKATGTAVRQTEVDPARRERHRRTILVDEISALFHRLGFHLALADPAGHIANSSILRLLVGAAIEGQTRERA
jgi:hypothetical protein